MKAVLLGDGRFCPHMPAVVVPPRGGSRVSLRCTVDDGDNWDAEDMYPWVCLSFGYGIVFVRRPADDSVVPACGERFDVYVLQKPDDEARCFLDILTLPLAYMRRNATSRLHLALPHIRGAYHRVGYIPARKNAICRFMDCLRAKFPFVEGTNLGLRT